MIFLSIGVLNTFICSQWNFGLWYSRYAKKNLPWYSIRRNANLVRYWIPGEYKISLVTSFFFIWSLFNINYNLSSHLNVYNGKETRLLWPQWSPRPDPPVAITILTWNLFCLVRFWKVVTDERKTFVKILTTFGCDCGSAEWINKSLLTNKHWSRHYCFFISQFQFQLSVTKFNWFKDIIMKCIFPIFFFTMTLSVTLGFPNKILVSPPTSESLSNETTWLPPPRLPQPNYLLGGVYLLVFLVIMLCVCVILKATAVILEACEKREDAFCGIDRYVNKIRRKGMYQNISGGTYQEI